MSELECQDLRPPPPFSRAFPVDESLFHEGLYVTHAGKEEIEAGDPVYPPTDRPSLYRFEWNEGRVLPEFCLAIVVAGSGLVETRNRPRPIHQGQCFFYFPGQWHRHRPSVETGWSIRWIFFNGDLPHRWMREKAFHLDLHFPVITDFAFFEAQFEWTIEAAYHCRSTNSTALSWKAAGLISHFLLDRRIDSEGKKGRLKEPFTEEAIEYIWNFSHNDLDVSSVVNAVGINRRALERRFKATIGRGILEEIQHCRLTRAACLLLDTQMPIKHIVERSGFSSRECMRLAFQKEFGMSPEAYRNSQLSRGSR